MRIPSQSLSQVRYLKKSFLKVVTMSMSTFIIRKPNKPVCLKVVDALGITELALESAFSEIREDLR